MIIKVGRLTSALLLIAVGTALLIDRWQGTAYLGVLLGWWPLMLILLGGEYLYYGLRPRSEDVQLKLDISSIIGAVVLSALIGAATNWQSLWQSAPWSKSIEINVPFRMSEWMGEAQPWQKVDKGITAIALPESTQAVMFRNRNGRISIHSGEASGMQVGVKVTAPGATKEEAAQIAGNTKLSVSEGKTLVVEVKSEEYGSSSRREPRVDLIITVPNRPDLAWELFGMNGDMEAGGLNGNIKITTANGDIEAGDIEGTVRAVSLNGDITVVGSNGDIDAKTTNGDIEAEGVLGSLKAETDNGDIEATAVEVNGGWELSTAYGDIEANLPADGDYSIHGQATLGEAVLDAADTSIKPPFVLSKHTIEGNRGKGTHRLNLKTHGDLVITLR